MAAGAAGATAAAMAPLKDIADLPTLEQFLQKHYKELTPDDKEAILQRIGQEVKAKYGVMPNLTDP